MRTAWRPLVGSILASGLLGWAAPAGAGGSLDFLFSVEHVNSDQQYFLGLTVSNYGYSRRTLEPLLPRLRNVEVDLPVALFLARESGRGLDVIVGWRSEGLSWSVILGRAGVPVDVLFAGIAVDPGPPYGKAWGYWKKNPRGARLSDADVSRLVQIQIGSRLAGVTPLELARARGQGRSVAVVVAEKKGRPYQKAKPATAARRGKGKPKP
ncbi:MAG: hypothetical protein HY509_01415 [Acidobacteria bacterium]|nr:hypothetical protein [Acidobacteriota bacterium]